MRNPDLGGGIPPCVPAGNRRHDLRFGGMAGVAVPVEDRDRRIQLIVHIEDRQRLMENRVPRRRPGFRSNRTLRRRRDAAVLKTKNERPIEPLIRNHNEAAARVENNRMRMRLSLMHRIRPGCALQRERLAHRQYAPIPIDWHHRHSTGPVICHHQMPFGGIQCRVHGICAAAILLVKQRQSTGRTIDAERTDQASPAMHRPQPCPRSVYRKQRRVFQPTDILQMGPSTIAGVDTIDIDAVAAPVAIRRGVAANESKHRAHIPVPCPLMYKA